MFNLINLQSLKQSSPHFPVLINQVIQNLTNLPNNATVLDGTFGAGGYTKHILQHTNANVIALDRDETVMPFVNNITQQYGNRFKFALSTFGNFNTVLNSLNISQVDAIVLDLGVSTMQLKNNRGFSFNDTADLSMQMGLDSLSTYNFINQAKENLIADVIYYYGEERKAKVIAKNIVNYRKNQPIQTTKQLVDIILSSSVYAKSIHPATKAMQGIRIYVNNELKELQSALFKSLDYLKTNGRLLVVSFHSLEDKIVKDFIKNPQDLVSNSQKFTSYKLNSNNITNTGNVFSSLYKKPLTATTQELQVNPPSSSAKLRVAIKNI